MARMFVPGLSVHVIRRGINHCVIFHDDDDRLLFLGALRDAARDTQTAFNALVLMDTHYHALATPPNASALASTMKVVGEQYVAYFNRKYARVGTLWTGRYRAISIQTEQYWFNCVRYLEQNPVRAGMARTPGEYAWSSYRRFAFGDDVRALDWLTEHPLYRALGPTAEDRQRAYRAICSAPLTSDELEFQRHPPRRRSAAVGTAASPSTDELVALSI